MNRVMDMVRSFVTRERLVQRFEKSVAAGTETGIDVFLKRGVEYVVRGKAAKGQGSVRLSLGDSQGKTVPIYLDEKGMFFSLIPEKDGVYQIRARVEVAANKTELVAVSVALSTVPTPSMYAIDPYLASWSRIAESETQVARVAGDTVAEEEYRQSKAS